MTLRGSWSRRALLRLYQAADCFVWPTLGEGWGYPPREAAATGLPVITPAHTGQADAAEWAYVIPHTEGGARAIFNTWGGQCGTFPTPDVDALADRMRWVFEHRDEAREFGRRASLVATRRTSADVARDILDLATTI
jgi:glycosyltransferase involved in cell wall biosynthesis